MSSWFSSEDSLSEAFLFWLEGSADTTSSAEDSGFISDSVLENDQLISQDGVFELGDLSGFGDVDFLAVCVDAQD